MRRIGVGVAGVLTLGALAACGNVQAGKAGSSQPDLHGDSGAVAVVQAAARTTSGQRSVHVSGWMQMDLPGAAASAGAGRVSATYTGDLATKPLAGRLVLHNLAAGGQSGSGPITEILTAKALYLKAPQLSPQLGKPWAEITFAELSSKAGLSFKQMMSQEQQMRPGQYIAQLAASGQIRKVGSEAVDGVQTTHYSGYVPAAVEIRHYDAALRPQMRALVKRFGFKGVDVDVWIDGHGLARRVVTSAKGGKASLAIRMDLSKYGEPVNVSPPPASQTVDLGKLAQGGGSSASASFSLRTS